MRLTVALLCLAGCAVPVEVAGLASCAKDSDCGALSVCEGQQCVTCPDAGSCVAPLNQVALQRNGCGSCTFAPSSGCVSDLACTEGSVCAKGARCAPGCSELTCCANMCGSKDCAAPIPIGCNMPCGAAEPGCATCVAAKCTCVAGGWLCSSVCTAPAFDAGCTALPKEP